MENTKIKFLKTREVKLPTRGTPMSAGIDFYVPTFNREFIEALKEKNPKILFEEGDTKILLGPGERILIPSGIKAEIPKGHALILFNKSGVSSKFGLDILACVIDEDYQGEIHINIVNTSDYFNNVEFFQGHYMGNMNKECQCIIEGGDKIVQGLLIPVLYSDIEEVTTIHNIKTERGEDGFGSTNRK